MIRLKKYSSSLKPVVNNIVIIDGITRTGKLLSGSLISSFKKMESLEFGENIEHFLPAIKLKKCNLDFAKCYLVTYLNQLIYNKFISRNSNFRPSDITSIMNFYNPSIYKKRLKDNEGDIVLKKIKKSKPIMPIVTHDLMTNYDIFSKLKINVKLIALYRNPFELTYSWLKRGRAKNLEISEREFTMKLEYKKNFYPWYLYQLPTSWKKFNDATKCAYYVLNLTKKSIKEHKKIKNKKNIYTTSYTNITENTEAELKKISKFLNTSFSSKTVAMIKKKNCPNYNISSLIDNKKIFLKKRIPNTLFQELIELEKKFKNNIYNLKN